MSKKPTQSVVTVNGIEYTLQSPGAAWYYEMIDRSRGADGALQISEINKELLDTVIVSPKVTLEDFELPGDSEKLLKAVKNFLGIGR